MSLIVLHNVQNVMNSEKLTKKIAFGDFQAKLFNIHY